MSDKELLQLAAKAMGGVYELPGLPAFKCSWNPIENNEEAVQLAVACGIRLGTSSATGLPAVIWEQCGSLHFREMAYESRLVPVDPIGWTRRAIVLAAAEIGSTK